MNAHVKRTPYKTIGAVIPESHKGNTGIKTGLL